MAKLAKAELKFKDSLLCDAAFKIVKNKPVWGKRISILGDFNGDGVQDTLKEKYISMLTGKETNKEYNWEATEIPEDCDSYDMSVKWAIEKEPISVLQCSDTSIGSFEVASGPIFGLTYLNNEGDLNGDGGDEITCIVGWADYSSSNSCRVLTYNNGKWKEVASFKIMEFDFQYNPESKKPPHPKYVFKKPDGKVLLKEFDGGKLGNTNWKRLNINW